MTINASGNESTQIRVSDEHPTALKIDGFKSLKEGWHAGEGVAFEPDLIAAGLSFHSTLICSGFNTTDAFAGLSGEIMITVYEGSNYLEFVLREDRQVEFLHEVGDEVRDELIFNAGEADARIRAFRRELWRLSESSPERTGTRANKDSPAWHLGIVVRSAAGGYPLLNATAFGSWDMASVSTSADSTR